MHSLLVLGVMFAALVLPGPASAQNALSGQLSAQTRVRTDQAESSANTPTHALPADGTTQALALQLSDVDAELGRLHAERRSLGLGWPITMMSLGVMTVAAGATVGLAAANTTTSGDAVWEVFRPFAIAGSLLFAGGAVFLGVRVHKRRANSRKIHALRARRQTLELQWLPTAPIARSTPVGLILSARF